MKIVHIITRLLRAGSEENTIANCLYQARQGHEVWLVHGNDFDPAHYDELANEIHLKELPELVHQLHIVQDYKAIRAFESFCRNVQPHVINTHQSKAGIVGRLGGRRAGVPVIIHGIHIAPFLGAGKLKSALYAAAERYAARSTTAFISVSDGMRDAFLQNNIGQPEQHHVVHSGMNIERFANAPLPSDWRDLLNLNETATPEQHRPPVVVMLAAFEPRKRHQELINAFRQVISANPDSILLFGGTGPIFEEIETYISSEGLSKNIKCLGHRSDPEKLIALADVCVLSSSLEGLPRVVVQYVAAGKPVVLSDLPGISEIVKNGENGVITSEHDIGQIGQILCTLFKDPEQLAKLAAGSKAKCVSSWSTETMCTEVEAIYFNYLKMVT